MMHDSVILKDKSVVSIHGNLQLKVRLEDKITSLATSSQSRRVCATWKIMEITQRKTAVLDSNGEAELGFVGVDDQKYAFNLKALDSDERVIAERTYDMEVPKKDLQGLTSVMKVKCSFLSVMRYLPSAPANLAVYLSTLPIPCTVRSAKCHIRTALHVRHNVQIPSQNFEACRSLLNQLIILKFVCNELL